MRGDSVSSFRRTDSKLCLLLAGDLLNTKRMNFHLLILLIKRKTYGGKIKSRDFSCPSRGKIWIFYLSSLHISEGERNFHILSDFAERISKFLCLPPKDTSKKSKYQLLLYKQLIQRAKCSTFYQYFRAIAVLRKMHPATPTNWNSILAPPPS